MESKIADKQADESEQTSNNDPEEDQINKEEEEEEENQSQTKEENKQEKSNEEIYNDKKSNNIDTQYELWKKDYNYDSQDQEEETRQPNNKGKGKTRKRKGENNQEQSDEDVEMQDKVNQHSEEEKDNEEEIEMKKIKIREDSNIYHEDETSESQEDDDNTINSMQTSHKMSRKEADKVINVESIRFTLQCQIEDPDLKTLEKVFRGRAVPLEETDTIPRLRKIFIGMMEVAHRVDESADVVPWSSKEKYVKLGENKTDTEKMSKDPIVLTRYFKNMSPMKKSGKKWIKIRIESKKINQVTTAIKEWASLHLYNFNK